MGRARARDRPLVVFLDHIARLSGGEIALARLLPALRDDVDILVVLGEDGPLVGRLRAEGFAVEVLVIDPALRDLPRGAVGSLSAVTRQLTLTLRYAGRVRRLLMDLQPDLLHTNSLKSAVYGGLAGRAAGVPVVWHVRDRIADNYLPVAAVWLMRSLSRVLPVAIIANSRATLSALPRSRRWLTARTAVVPDCVSGLECCRPLTAEGPLVFGVVGRLAHWKGQHVFLEAFDAAFRGTGHRARLVGSAMFGEAAYEQQLKDRIDALGLAQVIEMVGFREDMIAEYRALDVLVHCSVVPEPFGQVVVEGMASGLAVVAAAAGGPLDIIEAEVDGLLVGPDDVAALAAAMRRLDDDRDLLCRIGARATVSARRFTPEATASGVLAVYRASLRPARSVPKGGSLTRIFRRSGTLR